MFEQKPGLGVICVRSKAPQAQKVRNRRDKERSRSQKTPAEDGEANSLLLDY